MNLYIFFWFLIEINADFVKKGTQTHWTIQDKLLNRQRKAPVSGDLKFWAMHHTEQRFIGGLALLWAYPSPTGVLFQPPWAAHGSHRRPLDVTSSFLTAHLPCLRGEFWGQGLHSVLKINGQLTSLWLTSNQLWMNKKLESKWSTELRSVRGKMEK